MGILEGEDEDEEEYLNVICEKGPDRGKRT